MQRFHHTFRKFIFLWFMIGTMGPDAMLHGTVPFFHIFKRDRKHDTSVKKQELKTNKPVKLKRWGVVMMLVLMTTKKPYFSPDVILGEGADGSSSWYHNNSKKQVISSSRLAAAAPFFPPKQHHAMTLHQDQRLPSYF